MKKYEFYDTFIKTCEFDKYQGQGNCTKTRKSQQCIDNKCKDIRIPMSKNEILTNYYGNYNYNYNYNLRSHSQNGSGQNDKYLCPFCNKYKSTNDLINHIKKHINKTNKYKCPLCLEYHYIQNMETHFNKYHKILS